MVSINSYNTNVNYYNNTIHSASKSTNFNAHLPYYNNYYEQPEEQSPNLGKTATLAVILQGIAMSLQKVSNWCSTKLMQGKEFTSAENVKKIANKMIKDNSLNVEVGYIDKNNLRHYTNRFGDALGSQLEIVAEGKNAFYTDQLKLAVAPKSKPSLILHELGHAINAHKGKFLKFLQKSRGFASAAPTTLLMLDGLFRNKDDKPNFIEKNAGILGFLSFVPTIIEEGIASIRGIKAAKNVLGNSANLKALKRNYLFAWSTYLLAGIGLGVAAKQTFVQNRIEQKIL